MRNFLLMLDGKTLQKNYEALEIGFEAIKCNASGIKVQENFADQLRDLNLKKNLLLQLESMVQVQKQRKLKLRNLARMVRYSFKEAKGRTLKLAMRKVRKLKRKKPFFRTSKRAKKVSSKRGSVMENIGPGQKKELGWDGTTTVVTKHARTAAHKVRKSQNMTRNKSKLVNSRSRTPIGKKKSHGLNVRERRLSHVTSKSTQNLQAKSHSHLQSLEFCELSPQKETLTQRLEGADESMIQVKRKQNARKLITDSLDKTEFGNSKVQDLHMSKSSTFIPKLQLPPPQAELPIVKSYSQLQAVTIEKENHPSKAQQPLNKPERSMKKSKTSKFQSGNKRRRSLSRTKSFVDSSTGYKLTASHVDSSTGSTTQELSYSLFQNSKLATSEFRKHELEARLGGQRSQNYFDKSQAKENTYLGPVPIMKKVSAVATEGYSLEEDDDIDCISTTIRKS